MSQIVKYYDKCIRRYKIALWISVVSIIVLIGLSIFSGATGHNAALISCIILCIFPFFQIISNQKNIDHFERMKMHTLSIKSSMEDLADRVVENSLEKELGEE